MQRSNKVTDSAFRLQGTSCACTDNWDQLVEDAIVYITHTHTLESVAVLLIIAMLLIVALVVVFVVEQNPPPELCQSQSSPCSYNCSSIGWCSPSGLPDGR